MALDVLLLLCTFENSTKCDEISFDSHSFLEYLRSIIMHSSWLLNQINRIHEEDLSIHPSSFVSN